MNKLKTIIATICVMMMANLACKKSCSVYVPGETTSNEKKWIVTTVAGTGQAGFDDGNVSSAKFRAPLDVVIDKEGTIYIADAINHRIRAITNDQVRTIAGDGVADTTSGSLFTAKFELPSFLCIDNNGNLYTLDVEDPRIRKVSSDLVSVVAGSGINGYAEGDAATAEFGKECSGIVMNEQGTIYVLDWKNRRLRKITPTGHVSSVAGNGHAGFVDGPANVAEFFNPNGLAIDKQGNLYVGDWNRIRKISPTGEVSTFAGKDSTGFRDGPAAQALFTNVEDIVVDDQGNLFVSDENRIRKITPQGEVMTIAGSTGGYVDGNGSVAKFLGPVGLGIDKQGNIYVADDHNNRIRKITLQ